MANQKIQGIEAQQEVRHDLVRPDTRSSFKRLKAFWKTTEGVNVTMVISCLVAILLIPVPLSSELTTAWLLFFYLVNVKPGQHQKYDFPFRVPEHADLNDGSYVKRTKGKGITFLGKEISSRLEVWSSDSDLRTHLFVFGTTGSGKTEALLGIAFNALTQNTSGFVYVDGKGDPKLFENAFRLSRYMARDDDLLSISFLTSGRDFLEKQYDKMSNTSAPFAMGSSGMITELQISLMDDAGGGGDMWKGRAIAFLAALNKVTTYLRDKGILLLEPNTYIDFFELPVIENLVFKKQVRVNSTEITITDKLFDRVIEPLKAFVLTLPGYSTAPDKLGQQEQTPLQQFGFITMQLTRLFNDMSYTYSHLFSTALGEVDMNDVVLNRRILLVLLPALERSPDSLKMLGKITVGQIKQMMAGSLGNRVEGITREVIDSRPTVAKTPTYIMLDEYGMYSVVGFSSAPAQARSLGFSITFAAQDFASLKKASPEEAEASWENTNIRIIGRMTGGAESETFRKVNGIAGEALVEVISGKEHKVGEVGDSYRTNRDTRFEMRPRVTFQDLAGQENGEFTILVGKKQSDGTQGVRVIRARTFYTLTTRPKEMRLNHFLAIEPPSTQQVLAAQNAQNLEDALYQVLSSGDLAKILPDDTSKIFSPTNTTDTKLFKLAAYMDAADDLLSEQIAERGLVAAQCAIMAFTMESTEAGRRISASAESFAARNSQPDLSPEISKHLNDPSLPDEHVTVAKAPAPKPATLEPSDKTQPKPLPVKSIPRALGTTSVDGAIDQFVRDYFHENISQTDTSALARPGAIGRAPVTWNLFTGTAIYFADDFDDVEFCADILDETEQETDSREERARQENARVLNANEVLAAWTLDREQDPVTAKVSAAILAKEITQTSSYIDGQIPAPADLKQIESILEDLARQSGTSMGT